MTELTVHPVADLFPILADDELKELAADIAERGLLQPIVLDGPAPKGWLLDGRNRLKACEMAGVEPEFVYYDGSDQIGYIIAANINRRHLTKGQQAMVAAMALSETETSALSVSKSQGISKGRIGQAVTVRDHARDLVDAVISGAMGLDKAYEVARERKTAADSLESQLARLHAEDPELADKVREGDLSLPAAWIERKERVKRQRADIEAGHAAADRIVTQLKTAAVTIAIAARIGEPDLVTAEMVAACQESVDLLNQILQEGESP